MADIILNGRYHPQWQNGVQSPSLRREKNRRQVVHSATLSRRHALPALSLPKGGRPSPRVQTDFSSERRRAYLVIQLITKGLVRRPAMRATEQALLRFRCSPSHGSIGSGESAEGGYGGHRRA